jgi:hypothetical protein
MTWAGPSSSSFGAGQKRGPIYLQKGNFLKTKHYGVNGCHDSKEIVIWDFVSMHHLIHKSAINHFQNYKLFRINK